ncbi:MULTISPECIES: 3-oxoacyl-[acyl-carrier-protein] reductase [unclassified Aureispira]|uniref:3-oxoacyl-[acyl-carrier-protein] reductase n=1 Tax=unclassified Aureispira TaxID=2649989 RepID=UPI000697DB94|nr:MULTISPECIES: 3-oxoacyl-[acyl-carrier-protein] reductase [unclassified Aureispira]WMX15519.1 3-oxoacyl-[acyl-carrier-protein] reductase [Aureispira sp. CCB-E]
MKLLENKIALITGGSRGIGATMVKKFAEQGAHVAFTYRSSSEQANQLVEEASTYGTTIKAFASDASSFEQTQGLIADVIKEFGTIDILVNNAGVTRDNLLMRMTEDNWDDVMNNNLKSIYNFTKCIMRPMLKARGGSIINISSIVGLKGNAGQANYAASKAGMIGFTKSIAQEVGSRNIRCNAIAPGFIATDMTDELDEKVKDHMIQTTSLKRLGTTEEIANVAIFLASDMSSYITGETINTSGGM